MPPRRVQLGAVFATLALAFAVAGAIKRPPPAFAGPPIAVVRDADGHSLWAVRLAPRAHEIAVDALAAPAAPAGQGYQLWFAATDGTRTLGLLPTRGRKVIAEIPAIVARLRGAGALLVSREPARGSIEPGPSGPVVFRAALGGPV